MNNNVEKNCGKIDQNATAYQVCVQETLRSEQQEAMWGWIGAGVMMIAFCVAIIFIVKHE